MAFLVYHGLASKSQAVPILVGCLAAFGLVLTLLTGVPIAALANSFGRPSQGLAVLALVVSVGEILFFVFYAVVVLLARSLGLAEARRLRMIESLPEEVPVEGVDPWEEEEIPEVLRADE